MASQNSQSEAGLSGPPLPCTVILTYMWQSLQVITLRHSSGTAYILALGALTTV